MINNVGGNTTGEPKNDGCLDFLKKITSSCCSTCNDKGDNEGQLLFPLIPKENDENNQDNNDNNIIDNKSLFKKKELNLNETFKIENNTKSVYKKNQNNKNPDLNEKFKINEDDNKDNNIMNNENFFKISNNKKYKDQQDSIDRILVKAEKESLKCTLGGVGVQQLQAANMFKTAKEQIKEAIWKAVAKQAEFDESNKDLDNNGTYCSCKIVKIGEDNKKPEEQKYAFQINDANGQEVKIIFDKNSLFEDVNNRILYNVLSSFNNEKETKCNDIPKFNKYEEKPNEQQQLFFIYDVNDNVNDVNDNVKTEFELKVGEKTGVTEGKVSLSLQAYGSLLQKLASIHYDKFVIVEKEDDKNNITENHQLYKLGEGVRAANKGAKQLSNLSAKELADLDYVQLRAYEEQIWRKLVDEAQLNKKPDENISIEPVGEGKYKFVIQEEIKKDVESKKPVVKQDINRTVELIFDKGAFFKYKLPSGCGNVCKNVFNQFVYLKDWTQVHYEIDSGCKFDAAVKVKGNNFNISVDFSEKADENKKEHQFATYLNEPNLKVSNEDIYITEETKQKIRKKLAELGFGHLSAVWNSEKYKNDPKEKLNEINKRKAAVDDILKKNKEENEIEMINKKTILINENKNQKKPQMGLKPSESKNIYDENSYIFNNIGGLNNNNNGFKSFKIQKNSLFKNNLKNNNKLNEEEVSTFNFNGNGGNNNFQQNNLLFNNNLFGNNNGNKLFGNMGSNFGGGFGNQSDNSKNPKFKKIKDINKFNNKNDKDDILIEDKPNDWKLKDNLLLNNNNFYNNFNYNNHNQSSNLLNGEVSSNLFGNNNGNNLFGNNNH